MQNIYSAYNNEPCSSQFNCTYLSFNRFVTSKRFGSERGSIFKIKSSKSGRRIDITTTLSAHKLRNRPLVVQTEALPHKGRSEHGRHDESGSYMMW